MKIIREAYSPDLLDELINYYASMDTMSADDIWNEIVDQYGDEDLANDVVESLDDSWYDDGNEEGYH